ncbi:SufE family protein [Isoptericola halotolerans]|uniref:Cysteine desulfuration protein SufE n=1 Tax=Isoptericola halotolerans TaxID=300560 RepID=A0ABX2A128_9MICO|nr:SufE family protein [Isoptericola halotolerans]NOV96450.1 cysteine desulfuration protein SufE [Isoptericola halotolerans]
MTDDAPTTAELPAQLAEIREDFLALSEPDRLQLLLEFSRELPELPERYALAPGLLEKVEECQSPVRAFAEVDGDVVHFYASAPPEAPTTRGFASILAQGLSGLTPRQVLDVPEEFPLQLGLTRAVSALRLNGMAGMLTRAKRQVVEQLAAS